jgi:hypothetical protein
MVVSSAQASAWLEKNVHNRKLHQTVVDRYAKDMASGRWKYNHQAIIFDTAGTMLDGQHRCWGCVQSGASFDTDVVFGADPEVQDLIDDGLARTAGQKAALHGIENANHICAIARLVLIHRQHGIQSMQNPKKDPTKAEILELANSRDAQLEESASKVNHLSRDLCSPSILGFCHYVFHLQGSSKATRFFDYVDGDSMEVNPLTQKGTPSINSKYLSARPSRRVLPWPADRPKPEVKP